MVEEKKLNTDGIKQTYKDYLEYLSDSTRLRDDVEGYLIIENCTEDIDNCKYAYLEVFNDEKTSE